LRSLRKATQYFNIDQFQNEPEFPEVESEELHNIQNKRVSHEEMERAQFDDLLTESFYALKKVSKII